MQGDQDISVSGKPPEPSSSSSSYVDSTSISSASTTTPLNTGQSKLGKADLPCKMGRESSAFVAANVTQTEEMCSDLVPHSTGIQRTAPRVDNGRCQVCQDIAAGFYCGAFVCEACKKFFIRSSKQEKQKFVCLRQGTCTITKESRVQCQYCRYQKCQQLNMYYPGEGKRTVSSLKVQGIPCRVCGAPSSGFHFGALTCEGCKGFFRRMVKERDPGMYKCSAGESCEISMHTRNMCKACRYHKCIQIGMSVEGSRIGRQPNAVKYSISLEAKQQNMDQPPSTLSPTTTTTTVQESQPTSLPPATNKLELSDCPAGMASSAMMDSCTSSMAMMDVKEEENSIPLNNMELLEVPSAMEVDIKKEPVDETEEELLMSSIEQAAKELLHMCMVDRAKSDAFDESTFHTYALSWKKQMKHFEFHAQCVIRFAKKVKGFRDLELDDQVVLVQSAMYAVVVLNHSRYYELETGFYNYFNFSKAEEAKLLQMSPEFQMLQQHFKHIGFMAQTLRMTHMEYTLLSCLLLFDTECSGLLAVEQTQKLQDRIINLFQTYECKTYTDGLKRFGELLLRITELKLIAMQHIQSVSIFVHKHPDLEIPELYRDLYL